MKFKRKVCRQSKKVVSKSYRPLLLAQETAVLSKSTRKVVWIKLIIAHRKSRARNFIIIVRLNKVPAIPEKFSVILV